MSNPAEKVPEPHDALWADVRKRLIDEGLTPARAEALASALLEAETRPAALEELGDRLDRLTDVVERLATDVEHRDGVASVADTKTASPAPAASHERHVPHPIRATEHEVEHLRDVADKGESDATPALMAGGL